MRLIIAWSLFALGVAHIAFGVKRFKIPLAAAVSDGFVGQFKAPEERRTAFWFLIVAPLLMLAGQISVHAVATGDLWVLRLVGIYLLVTSLFGVLAFPKSPLWASLVLAPLFIAVGCGLL